LRLLGLLLLEFLLVEFELLSLQQIPVAATTLTGPGRHARQEATSSELILQTLLQRTSLLSLSQLGLQVLTLLLGGALGLLLGRLLLLADGNTIELLVPLTEGRSIDLDDTVLHEGVGTDQLVVGRIVNDREDTGLAGGDFRAPAKISRVKSQSSILEVSSTATHHANSLRANAGHGGGAAELKLTLLADGNALATGRPALVYGVPRDTHV